MTETDARNAAESFSRRTHDTVYVVRCPYGSIPGLCDYSRLIPDGEAAMYAGWQVVGKYRHGMRLDGN